MNERIEQLAVETLSFLRDNVLSRSDMEDISIPNAFLEKFAESIVRECAKRCDEVIKESEISVEQCKMVKSSDRLMMLHDGTRNGAQMSKNRFKQYFGVSE